MTDISLEMRLLRWTIAIKTVLSSSVHTIFGMGPSFWGVALDGYYVRVFVESGILGLFSFIIFLYVSIIKSPCKIIRNYIVVLIITGVFIDIFVTDKAMFILWLFLGYFFKKDGRENENA